MSNEQQTEEKILHAAMKVFSRKGFAGARMQEIADEAGINKAALHYYFRSKQLLFEKIFGKVLSQFISKITEQLITDDPIADRIKNFCDYYISSIQTRPNIPNFVINELNQNPDYIFKVFNNLKIRDHFNKFRKDYAKEVEEGNFIEIDPKQLVANMISLIAFPFVAKPIMQFNFNLDEEAYKEFIEERKKLIPEFILNSIKIHK